LRSGFTFPPWSRLLKPPCDPGRPDFPGPVLPLAVRPACLLGMGEVEALTRIRPYPGRFTHGRAPPSRRSTSRHSVRLPLLDEELPNDQRPFAQSTVLQALGQRPIRCRGERRPPVLAHTDACARPDPSRGIRPRPLLPGLCRLRSAPARRWSFPTLFASPSLRAWTPTPAAPGVLIRVLPASVREGASGMT
jgi:hypothetical protein